VYGNPPAEVYDKSYTPEETVSWRRGDANNGRTFSYPPYRFTGYSVGVKKSLKYLVTRNYGVNGVNRFYQYGHVSKVGGNCTNTIDRVTESGPMYSTYMEQTRDFGTYNTYELSRIQDGEIQAALYSVQNDMVSEALTNYDFLTDIAEARDIPRTLYSISSDLQKIARSLKSRHGADIFKAAASMSPRSMLKSLNKLVRKFGDEWMAYRYGIMPLVYSLRDVLKTVDRGTSVTTRKMRVVNPSMTGTNLPGPTSTYKVEQTVGSVTIRGETF